jgi:HD-like signal output (HDOD) protein
MMGGPSKKEAAGFDRAHFIGLTDNEIVSLYNVGTVKTLKPGEFLIREGGQEPAACLVTGGSLKVAQRSPGMGRELTVASCPEGTWLGKGRRTAAAESPYSVYAPEHTTILVLNGAALDLLDSKVRSFLYAMLGASTADLMRRLVGKMTALTRKNGDLISALTRMADGARRDYPRMAVVQDLLKDFPRLPLFVDKLVSMLLNDMVSTTEIVEYAKTDPSIVSTTLKRINSPYYSISEKITDFHRAVMLLGFNQICQIALEECVFELFPKSFRTREFHVHSILISLIGFELAILTGMQKPAAQSTVGLIHDIGHVLLQLLKNRNGDIDYLIDGLDGAEIAAMLFEQWSFPASICDAIRFQGHASFAPPDRIPAEMRASVALLHVSHLVCDYMQGAVYEEPSSIFMDEYMDFLGLSGLSIKEAAQKNIYPPLIRKIDILPEDIRIFMRANLPG